jgi:transposase
MKTLHRRCAGLDVHKKEAVACLRLVIRGKATYEVGRFSTTTRGLLELADWLEQAGCTHVAMEATGVYWKPVWHMLEGCFQQILANAAHIKGVPGRKSDMNDATWIADLLTHGLIRATFVPPRPIQELRDLTRTRKQLTREVVQHTQRIQAVLEEANIKLSSVITDIVGQRRPPHPEGDRRRRDRSCKAIRARWLTSCRNTRGTYGGVARPRASTSSLPHRAALEDHRATRRDGYGLASTRAL